ncbi:MAG: protein adenylyltransferase SelO family protein, partial [Nannocystaceae bacterium]
VLRSSLREFVCSEAMHHLGVPTTRALSLALTGDEVIRDMMYDGNPRAEPGAVVCRAAPSFLRFGSLEIHAARGDTGTLKLLADHIIRTHAPELDAENPEVYAQWFHEVCRATAHMICQWMRVGFVHGVMNTDNMSVHGLTIDYGPYGWIDNYDPRWTPNTTDAAQRRYRFEAQPSVAAWNLGCLASAILPLVSEKAPLEEGLEEYWKTLEAATFDAYAAKLGLPSLQDARLCDEKSRSEAASLIHDLGDLLAAMPTDMTIFFRQLAQVPTNADASATELLAPIREAYYEVDGLTEAHERRTVEWLRDLARRARDEAASSDARADAMRGANPKYVPRNYLAQLAIEDAERGDLTKLHALVEALQHPYDEQPEHDALARRRPDWATHKPGCSMLSCSS